MKTGVSVYDAMTKNPITVGPETTLKECAKIMAKNDINSLIITRGEKLMGLITDEDFVRTVTIHSLNPERIKVKDIMITKLVTIAPERDIAEAMKLMGENRCIRQLPVTKGKKLSGILTWRDIVKIEPTLFEIFSEKFRIKEEKLKLAAQEEDIIEGKCEMCGRLAKLREAPGGDLVCRFCEKKLLKN